MNQDINTTGKVPLPVDEEIEFVPNISAIQGGGLQLWMNALQSGKDVHCNLTSENGLLKLTLVDPFENIENTNLKENVIDVNLNVEEYKDELADDQKTLVEWGLFQNGEGNIEAHPVNSVVEDKFNSEDLEALCSDNIVDTSTSAVDSLDKNNRDVIKSINNGIKHFENWQTLTDSQWENTKSNDTSTVSPENNNAKHTVIVTVATDDVPDTSKEAEIVDDSSLNYTRADVNSFPCVRNEWYCETIDTDDKTQLESHPINTTALSSDLRDFLRHHSISLANFSKNVLERSQGTLSDLLNHPKPWSGLSSRGKSMYRKMLEFLSSDNLHTVLDELRKGITGAKRGPALTTLPPRLMEMLAKRVMPPVKMLNKVAQEYQLKLIYLKSYCENQLKKSEDSLDVIVEFEGGLMESTDHADKSEEILPDRSHQPNTVRLKSGFEPRSTDKQICPVLGCGQILCTKMALKTHLLTHSGQRPHKCNLCDRAFSTVSNLRSHEKRHAKNKISKRALKCAMLRSQNAAVVKAEAKPVKLHPVSPDCDTPQLKESSETHPIAKKCTFSCGVCLSNFPSKRLLRSHVTHYHIAAVMRDDNCLVCRCCKKQFNSLTALAVHERKHNNERPYMCKHCKKRFFTNSNCLRHMRTHSSNPKPHKCPVCGACFAEMKSLLTHKRVHTGERPYRCDKCDRCFAQSSTLISHRLLHDNVRPYLCATCGKAFRQKANLRIHEERHRGNRPYVCDVCKNGFQTKADLQRHMIKHSTRRRFVCNKCSMSYSRLAYLTEHAYKVHNISPYKCDKCGREFSSKSNYSSHQLTRCEPPLNTNSVTKTGNDQQLPEQTINNESSYPILQVFPNTVCCIPPPENPEPDLTAAPISAPIAHGSDPAFITSAQSTSFPPEANVPVAIVTDRGYVLASSTGVESGILSPALQDANDPNMHSVIVASEDCEHMRGGTDYVVVSVASDVAVLTSDTPLGS